MANKVIQVYPSDLTVKRVREAELVQMNDNGKSSESSAINTLIVRLGNVEMMIKEMRHENKKLKGEILDLKSELGTHQDNARQESAEGGI